MRLGLNARVAVTALGVSITRSGEFSLDDFSEEQIRHRPRICKGCWRIARKVLKQIPPYARSGPA
jgi:hypothetical protein